MNLEALAELRAANLQGPFLPGTLASPGFHLGMLQSALKHGGQLEHLGDRAFVLWWTDPAPEGRRMYAMVHYDELDPAALTWCLHTIERVLPELDDTIEITVGVRQRTVWQHLRSLGLGLNAVNLAGRVDLALERLIERYDPPTSLPGLEIRCAIPADADAVVALRVQCFEAEPIYHCYGAHPALLQRARAQIEQPDGRRTIWVVEEAGAVLGMFEQAHIPACPHHGSAGGTGLIFAPRLRGRGLAAIAYRHLLENAAAQELAWLKGTTGRQPVMHLARVMGRGVTGVVLRRNFVFEPGWFEAVLPGSG